MAERMSKAEARKVASENPFFGDVGAINKLYNVLSGIGAELGGADMGTPFGQRYGETQRAGEAYRQRAEALHAAYPEEYERARMEAADRLDPYMLEQTIGPLRAMRPGVTTFSQLEGPARIRQGAAEAARAEGARGPSQVGYAPRPAEPYYRNVPAEMGTSTRPMGAFDQNMYGMTTGRYGPMGAQYMPEMAVSDFESYAPGGLGRTTTGPTPISGFDQNMLNAYRQRAMRFGQRSPVGPQGEGYTLEELGSAVAPYRQGGLVYEPVGGQGAGPRQIGGPQGAPRLGYERGPLEGQWSEVYGLEGPPRQPYTGGMDFGVTRDGMAVSPTGMPFDPRLAGVAAGAGGLGYVAGRGREMPQAAPEGRRVQLPPIDVRGARATTALSGQAPAAPEAFQGQRTETAPAPRGATTAPKGAGKTTQVSKAGGKAGEKKAEAKGAAFDPNLNYLVTQALDQLLGQNQAEAGRRYQEYYATNPWPY